MKIAALVSGGVDSSVTIPILKEQGYDPHIFYIRIAMENEPGFTDCPSEEDIEITTYIARKYSCKFDIIDLKQEYWDRVVSYTLETVKKGFTPNPDIMCNRFIKFGSFKDKLGGEFDKISTGHYASTIEKDGEVFLSCAKDKHKDQTYFLGRITYDQLSKVMFPLGNLEKPEVRRMAEKLNLPSAARPDSQGICFLGKINYSEFIRKYTGENPGEIIELETGKVIGEHKGLWFHTIGQRKGLGLSQGPWFVVKKDIQKNIVYVSNGYDPIAQYKKEIILDDFLFINEKPDRNYESAQTVFFKIRHQPEFNAGQLIQDGEKFKIISDVPISGVAPGQFGVVYDTRQEICLGSGVIV